MTDTVDTVRVTVGDLEGKVHIWHYHLDLGPEEVGGYLSVLDDSERERAHRFKFEKHRRRFIVGRGTLRRILARYAGCEPESICLEYGKYGKPYIAGPGHVCDLKFSVSHCGDLGAVAVTMRAELGLDLERIRPDGDRDLIVSREFSAEEQGWFHAAPETHRAVAFCEIWTCKEAYLKGKGIGLTAPLRRFSISFDRGRQPRLAWSEIDSLDPQRWLLHRLVIEPGFIGCLALRGESLALHMAPWSSGV